MKNNKKNNTTETVMMNQTKAGKVFDCFNYIFFFVMSLIMLAPLLYVFIGSFSSTGFANLNFGKFSAEAYRQILASKKVTGALLNSILITLVGTALRMAATSAAAYALSKSILPGRKFLMKVVVFFMLFWIGMIPDYILEANVYHLKNTYWVYWLKGLISSSNLIIMINFFKDLPAGVEESAYIDGCNDLQTFVKIALPMSKAAIATFSLFYAVDLWNDYLKAIIYIDDSSMWPITVWLRQFIVLAQGTVLENASYRSTDAWLPTNAVKFATITISVIPILMIYPFVQKHFSKGVMIGAIKG